MGITLAAYGPTWVPKGSVDLSESFGRSFLDHLSETGTFDFALGLENPAVASLAYDDKIVLSLDGNQRFGGVVEKIDENPVDQSEEAGQVAKIGGKGNAVILDWAKVFPEFGVTRRTPDMRPMDFSAAAFDDSAWPTAYSIQTGASGDGPWPGNPEGWPDPAARWIWTQPYVGGSLPNGETYYRGWVYITTSSRYAVFGTADDGFEVWCDGARLLGEQTAYMFNAPRRVDIDLDVGWHLFAIHGRNAYGGPAGVLLTVLVTTNGGRDLGTVVLRTNTSWKCLGYPAQAPGMTPGRIVRVFREEAVARGMWNGDGGLTLAFNDFTDSAGQAWSAAINPAFSVGASYLDVIRQISEFGFDWHMDPTSNTLRMWNAEGVGADGVTVLTKGVNIGTLTRQGSSETRANVLLSRYRGGGVDQQGWIALNDPYGSQNVRRREAFLSAGQQDQTYVQQLANAVLAGASIPTEAITAEPVERPDAVGTQHCRAYIDYVLGGWIHVPNRAGVSTRYRVKGITITEDAEGRVTEVPELSTIALEWAERLQKWVKRMVPGTLEGSSETAGPPTPPPTFDVPVDVPNQLSDLVDVSNLPAAPGDFLGFDPDLGWTPEPFPDIGGGGGGGGIGTEGMPQFSISGPLGVGRTVGHTTGGGDAANVRAHLAVAGESGTTFDIVKRGAPNLVLGTFTIPANTFEISVDWAHTFDTNDHIWVACTVPGNNARGLGVQIS